MNDRAQLADDLERALADEPLGLSCNALVRRLHRRRRDLLDVLRDDPRFEPSGTARGTRWRLVAPVRAGTFWDVVAALGQVADRLDALEARIDALERRNGVYA